MAPLPQMPIQSLGALRNKNSLLDLLRKLNIEPLHWGATEISWIYSLLRELCILISFIPVIYSANIGATQLCANPIVHTRMKHIALNYHFVRELVHGAKLWVSYVSSEDQFVDALTKSLSNACLRNLIFKIGISLEPPS